MTLSRWTRSQLESGGWIRRMFAEGVRLRAEYGDDAVVDLSLGQPLPTSDDVADAFRAAASERFPGRFEYMPNLGYPDVRERTAAESGIRGISMEQVAMTQGAAAAMCVAIRAFVDPGQDVIGIAPYFPEFRRYAETASARFVPVTVRDDMRLDFGAIAAALTRSTAAVIVNSPNNPSGHVLDALEYRELAALLHEHNDRYGGRVLLIVDEVYRRIIYPPSRYELPFDFYEHAVLARSFSKDLGIAGERIGYLVVHPSLTGDDTRRGLEVAMRALGFVNAPATAQRALLHLETWDVDLSAYEQRRNVIFGCARDAKLDAVPPQGGLYLWLRSPWDDTMALIEELIRRRVLGTPGIAFGMPSHIRFCFSYAPEKLRAAIAAVADAAREAPIAHNIEPVTS